MLETACSCLQPPHMFCQLKCSKKRKAEIARVADRTAALRPLQANYQRCCSGAPLVDAFDDEVGRGLIHSETQVSATRCKRKHRGQGKKSRSYLKAAQWWTQHVHPGWSNTAAGTKSALRIDIESWRERLCARQICFG